MRARIVSALFALSLFAAACEDEGNPGDDNLLSGASLIIVLVVVAIIVAVVLSRRGRT